MFDCCTRPDCFSCGAHIGRSCLYVWHHMNEDCRALKQPNHEEHNRSGGAWPVDTWYQRRLAQVRIRQAKGLL